MIDLRDAELIDFVPESIAEDPEILALSLAVGAEMREIADALIEIIIWPRISPAAGSGIEPVSEAILDVLAWDMRMAELTLWDTATLAGKRAIMRNVFAIRKKTGTRYAVRRILDLLELTATIVEWFEEDEAPYTYRIIINTDAIGLALATLLKIPDLALRFAPARCQLSSITEELSTSGPMVYRPVVSTGLLITTAIAEP